MSRFITAAKQKQIENFRNAVGSVIKEDTLITNMPNIRINANKSALPQAQFKQKVEQNKQRMQSMPVARFLATHRREANLH